MIWAIADTIQTLEAEVGALQSFGETIGVVFISNGVCEVALDGVTEAYVVTDPTVIDDYGAALVDFLRDKEATVVAFPSTIRGRAVAGYVAAKLGTAVFNGLTAVEKNDNSVILTRMAYGGAADRKEAVGVQPVVLTVGAGAFKAQSGSVLTAKPLVLSAGRQGITECTFVKTEGERVDLNAAKYVVGVGRGFGSKDELSLAVSLADTIGGAVGCSRPVAEGLDWMPKETYIGSTGAVLNADVYIACGISGQIQHMSGALGCKTIFAINKDPDALIFNYADYGLIGSVEDVLPKLVNTLKQ